MRSESRWAPAASHLGDKMVISRSPSVGDGSQVVPEQAP